MDEIKRTIGCLTCNHLQKIVDRIHVISTGMWKLAFAVLFTP